jgi:hypothetical protein
VSCTGRSTRFDRGCDSSEAPVVVCGREGQHATPRSSLEYWSNLRRCISDTDTSDENFEVVIVKSSIYPKCEAGSEQKRAE